MAKEKIPPEENVGAGLVPAQVQPSTPPVFYRAKLDADRVYWGVEQVAALADGDVEVPKDCDLKPGHYRHNDQALPDPCFEPLPRSQRKNEPGAPMADRALYELLWQIHSDGGVIPQYCADWACHYEITLDADLGKLFKRRFARALGRVDDKGNE